ncbi:MAG: DMT family transporter [Pleomorphochaeta sp.]
MSNLLFGQMLAIIVAITSAEKSIIFSYLGKNISTRATVHVRLWIATPIIIILALLTEGTSFLNITISTWIILLTSGVIGYFICDSFAFWAYANLGPRESMVIMTLNPIFHSILSYFFFSEVLTFRQMFAILITITGIITLILNQEKKDNIILRNHQIKGIFFAFLGAIFQAISNILAKSALDNLGPISTNSIRMIGGLIAAAIFAGVYRKEFIHDFKLFNNKKAFSLLSIATISGPIIGITVLLTSFNYAPVGLVTAIAQISPIFILIYEITILKKGIKPLEMFGTLISVFGVTLMFL